MQFNNGNSEIDLTFDEILAIFIQYLLTLMVDFTEHSSVNEDDIKSLFRCEKHPLRPSPSFVSLVSGHAQHLYPLTERPWCVTESCDTNHIWGQTVVGRNM